MHPSDTRKLQKSLGRPRPLGTSESGISVRDLRPGEHIVLRTRNSVYRLVVVDPAGQKVLVHGGRFFRGSVPASLLGSSDESHLYLGKIVVGCGVEIMADERWFVTSPLVGLTIERAERAAG